MDMNPVEPMAKLNALLSEITKMPLGPERDKKWNEAYELFGPAAEELSILGGQIRVLAERNQNGESLKSFMKKAGVDIPIVGIVPAPPQKPSMFSRVKSGVHAVSNYWDRKKGKLAVFMALTTVLFFYANQRNIKMLNDFTHENNLVGLFEDWLQIEDEDERETPLNWRELEEASDV